MHKASLVLAAGADFRLIGPKASMLQAKVPVVSVCAVRTGSGKSQTTRRVAEHPARRRAAGSWRSATPCPTATWCGRRCSASPQPGGPRPPPLHDRGARGVRAAHRGGRRHLRRRRLRGDPGRGREGGRRHPLGRRQQRPAVLQGRPGDRGRRPAPPRPRADATTPARPTCAAPTSSSSTRSTPPTPEGVDGGAPLDPRAEPRGDGRRRRLAALRRRPRGDPRQAGAGRRGRPDPHPRRDEVRRGRRRRQQASGPRRSSTRGPTRSARSRRTFESTRGSARCCPPWATARSRCGTWRPRSSGRPPTWC